MSQKGGAPPSSKATQTHCHTLYPRAAAGGVIISVIVYLLTADRCQSLPASDPGRPHQSDKNQAGTSTEDF